MEDRPHIDITDHETPQASAGITKAVAIQHEKANAEVPRVVASGKGAVAEQILAIAFERGIKVREDAELVEILSLIDVDSPIPLEAFAAVAEILAHVYKANAHAKQEKQP